MREEISEMQAHTNARALFISLYLPNGKNIYFDGRWKKKKLQFDPSFPHLHRGYVLINQALRFPNPPKKIPDCLEHIIQIREKRKTDPCTKNSRNAIRINLFYAEVKRRWWEGRRNNCWNTHSHMLCFWMTLKKDVSSCWSVSEKCAAMHNSNSTVCFCGMEVEMKSKANKLANQELPSLMM